MNAVQVLSKLEPQLLALFAEPLVARLEDATLSVRGASRCALGLLAPEVLALHGDAIIRCCSSEHAGVRVDAMSTLALLEPVVLRQGARRKALLCGLEDSDKDVRVAAVKAVARLQTLVYFGHGDQHTSCAELPSTVLVSDVGEDKQQTVSDGTGSGATWRQTVGAPKKREPAQQRPPLPQVQVAWSSSAPKAGTYHLVNSLRAVQYDASSSRVRWEAKPFGLGAPGHGRNWQEWEGQLSKPKAAWAAPPATAHGLVRVHEHVGELVDRLEDLEFEVRKAALQALRDVERPVLAHYAPAIAARLDHSQWGVRKAAHEALALLAPLYGDDAPDAHALPGPTLREAVRKGLAKFRGGAPPAAAEAEAGLACDVCGGGGRPRQGDGLRRSAAPGCPGCSKLLDDKGKETEQAPVKDPAPKTVAFKLGDQGLGYYRLDNTGRFGNRVAAADAADADAAISALRPPPLPKEVFEQMLQQILSLLEHLECGVRAAALQAFALLRRDVLAQHASTLVRCLEDDDATKLRQLEEPVVRFTIIVGPGTSYDEEMPKCDQVVGEHAARENPQPVAHAIKTALAAELGVTASQITLTSDVAADGLSVAVTVDANFATQAAAQAVATTARELLDDPGKSQTIFSRPLVSVDTSPAVVPLSRGMRPRGRLFAEDWEARAPANAKSCDQHDGDVGVREAAVATLSCLPKNELAAHAAAMAAILNHERPHPRERPYPGDDDVDRRKKLGGPPQKAEKHGPRESAALALALLEPDALQAQIPFLIERLGDPVKSVRDAVVAALGRLPPDVLQHEVDNARKYLDGASRYDVGVRVTAVEMLAQLQPPPPRPFYLPPDLPLLRRAANGIWQPVIAMLQERARIKEVKASRALTGGTQLLDQQQQARDAAIAEVAADEHILSTSLLLENEAEQLARARGEIEKYIRDHDIFFNRRGDENLPEESQAWNIHHLDPELAKENLQIIREIASILKKFPMIALRVHGQAAGEPDRDTGFIHPSFETLAHDRAAACRDALADEGVDAAARCIVTAQGDGDEQKVDFVPLTEAQLHAMRREQALRRGEAPPALCRRAQTAAPALTQLGVTVAELIRKELIRKDAGKDVGKLRAAALRALCRLFDAATVARVVDQVVMCLGHADADKAVRADVRVAALVALRKLEPATTPHMRAQLVNTHYMSALDDTERAVRKAALDCLRSLEPDVLPKHLLAQYEHAEHAKSKWAVMRAAATRVHEDIKGDTTEERKSDVVHAYRLLVAHKQKPVRSKAKK